jgi:sec-independent protein translocase protein TatA
VDVGPTEILIVLLVIVILFGAKKLPDLARSLGRSSSEFKKGLKEGANEERPLPDPRTEPRSEAAGAGEHDMPQAGEERPPGSSAAQ